MKKGLTLSYLLYYLLYYIEDGILEAIMEEPKRNGKLSTFNLKLKDKVRVRFKKNTHDRGTTMQAVLSAFAETYIENPDKFRLVMEVEG